MLVFRCLRLMCTVRSGQLSKDAHKFRQVQTWGVEFLMVVRPVFRMQNVFIILTFTNNARDHNSTVRKLRKMPKQPFARWFQRSEVWMWLRIFVFSFSTISGVLWKVNTYSLCWIVCTTMCIIPVNLNNYSMTSWWGNALKLFNKKSIMRIFVHP